MKSALTLKEIVEENEYFYGSNWHFTAHNTSEENIREMESAGSGIPQILWPPTELSELGKIGCATIWHSVKGIPPVVVQVPLQDLLPSHHGFNWERKWKLLHLIESSARTDWVELKVMHSEDTHTFSVSQHKYIFSALSQHIYF